MDRSLDYRDLWTTLQYTHFSTVYSRTVGPTWYRPRKKYADPELTVASPPAMALAPLSELELQLLRRAIANDRLTLAKRRAPAVPGHPASLSSLPPTLLEDTIKVCFPAPCRPRTLILVSHLSPFYLNLLSPSERAEYFEMATLTVEVLEHSGVRSMEIGKDFPVEYYLGPRHLTVAGGRQMAGEVALRVLEMARQLGHTTRSVE